MKLFFDTETMGLAKDWNARVHNLRNWPRIVQLAWTLTDDNGEVLTFRNRIIDPEDMEIPEASSKIHGITTDEARLNGIKIETVLAEFATALDISNALIAHNINFDYKVIGAEYLRLGGENTYQKIKEADRICTMHASTDFCKLQSGRATYKWPKLQELHKKLFKEEFDGAHDAMADVNAMIRCFFKLKELKIL